MVLKHLHAWEHKNGSKPEAIVIYRDGASFYQTPHGWQVD